MALPITSTLLPVNPRHLPDNLTCVIFPFTKSDVQAYLFSHRGAREKRFHLLVPLLTGRPPQAPRGQEEFTVIWLLSTRTGSMACLGAPLAPSWREEKGGARAGYHVSPQHEWNACQIRAPITSAPSVRQVVYYSTLAPLRLCLHVPCVPYQLPSASTHETANRCLCGELSTANAIGYLSSHRARWRLLRASVGHGFGRLHFDRV